MEYFLQEATMGLAYMAPIGMHNVRWNDDAVRSSALL